MRGGVIDSTKVIVAFFILLIWSLVVSGAVVALGLLMGILYGGLWQILFVPLVVLTYVIAGWIAPNAVRSIPTLFHGLFFLGVLLIRVGILKDSHMSINQFGVEFYRGGNPTLLGVLAECGTVAVSMLVLMLLFRVGKRLSRHFWKFLPPTPDSG
jgi:hypothetical protein